MNNQPIAAILAVDATRRHVEGTPVAQPRPRARRSRRVLATTLQAAAHKLDPCVTAPPRPSMGR